MRWFSQRTYQVQQNAQRREGEIRLPWQRQYRNGGRAGTTGGARCSTWRKANITRSWSLWPFATYCTATHPGRYRGIAEIDSSPSIAESDARLVLLGPSFSESDPQPTYDPSSKRYAVFVF